MSTQTNHLTPSLSATSRRSRRSPAVGLAAAAGVAWFALGTESILRPDPAAYRDVAFLVPWVLTLGTLVALHRLQRHALGRVGRASFGLLVVSMSAVVVLTAPALLGQELVRHFTYAVPVWVLAMAAYGVATARAGVLPRWAGAGIALTEPVTIATGVALSPLVPLSEHGSFSGAVAHGVIFLALARGLTQHRSAGDGPAPRTTTTGRR